MTTATPGGEGRGGGTLVIPVELLLLLDLQYGGIVVQDGQNDLVHVLPKTQVYLLLLLQGLHQLQGGGVTV